MLLMLILIETDRGLVEGILGTLDLSPEGSTLVVGLMALVQVQVRGIIDAVFGYMLVC